MLTTENTEDTEAATPETDDQPCIMALNNNGYQVPCVDIKFARKLERERDEWYYKAHANAAFTLEARAQRDEARAELLAMARKALEGWE